MFPRFTPVLEPCITADLVPLGDAVLRLTIDIFLPGPFILILRDVTSLSQNFTARLSSFSSFRMSHRALAVFIALQALDVLTTILGLRLGAGESSMIVSQLMRLGTLPGLLVSKVLSLLLLGLAVSFGRGRMMRLLNPWYAGVVTWNLVAIMVQAHLPA